VQTCPQFGSLDHVRPDSTRLGEHPADRRHGKEPASAVQAAEAEDGERERRWELDVPGCHRPTPTRGQRGAAHPGEGPATGANNHWQR